MAKQSYQTHLLIIEDDRGRKEFPLEESIYCIGRDPSCEIRLYSQFVSRRHATIERRHRDDGSFYYQIVDGDRGKPSANGLMINGRKLPTHILEDKDEIVFGPQVSAIYYVLKREAAASGPLDEFDITLISPNMIDDLD
ncbi:FHA domain-containing protein [Desertifilum sp. FACHB-1129]|uniref:Phosphopeptide-binding protein n=1 Tax=Desertifilum tharense IPPAS B-1220 TaxID=1781255 RepID=A0A1E5QQ74_9CYAN|nr:MULTISPECIES: FHA domain-containing protein [Desertifilum]MCD8486148.1 FHA domain-containing protein [Desertifilum sp.]MDA0209172.1 FHA domain-containing protein [Cyanobacteria bacterium FC1]MBD2311826.1 FHA domain-containing protein [Desertifilum sp. FACHB-1129]MBD2322970.1 FHA domain-containing protein [Desertifilum sp. FACHB-866]MBD2333401.1 FHA domain-containing protein [Desertifilum sp. FACHB-868]